MWASMRAAASQKDLSQLQEELNETREKLQLREKELLYERQESESARQRQAIDRQSLMARLAALETPMPSAQGAQLPKQTRETKSLKLPRWMVLEK